MKTFDLAALESDLGPIPVHLRDVASRVLGAADVLEVALAIQDVERAIQGARGIEAIFCGALLTLGGRRIASGVLADAGIAPEAP